MLISCGFVMFYDIFEQNGQRLLFIPSILARSQLAFASAHFFILRFLALSRAFFSPFPRALAGHHCLRGAFSTPGFRRRIPSLKSADTKEYRDYWLPRFERAAKEPAVWALQSSSLMKAARLLRPEIDGFFASVRTMKANDSVHAGHDLAPVFMMLMAFAAENLLKGILIARHPHRVTPAKLSKWEGGGHDLIELAKTAKLPLTRDEMRLLLTLSLHGEWLGRYPCPLQP
jgi:hypothetical protein